MAHLKSIFPGDNGTRLDLWASGDLSLVNEWSASMNVAFVHGLFVHMLPVKKGTEREQAIAWRLIHKELKDNYSFRHNVHYVKSMYDLTVRRLYSWTANHIRAGKNAYNFFTEVIFFL